jgi:hypothetical protein
LERPNNGWLLPDPINIISMQSISRDDHLRGGVKSLFIQHAKPRTYNAGVAKLWTPADSLFAHSAHVMPTTAGAYVSSCFIQDWSICKASNMKDTDMCKKLYESMSKRYEIIKVM